MVVKLLEKMGFLEFLGGKEEEEGGVEVVLLLEWWRRWRRERWKKLVVEEMERVAGQGGRLGGWLGAAVG